MAEVQPEKKPQRKKPLQTAKKLIYQKSDGSHSQYIYPVKHVANPKPAGRKLLLRTKIIKLINQMNDEQHNKLMTYITRYMMFTADEN